ncbi:reverse transcriptase [Phytophthora megakarya]|uniref:Reverse transcriptase n=1 Tax=Phytophthora megakarya TaxID=4795 RepID=A0A225W4V6_9STRA|nr:reverse transcriptase [Phytophthora megakarya]
MRAADIPYTAFQAPDGLYDYLVVPMGLSNALATFNNGIRRILGDLVDICQSYFDDIYVFTRIFARLDEHKFFVKLSKCVFCADSIPCLDDIVGREGVNSAPTKHGLQSFLGTAAYVQRFCHRFADDAGLLFNLLKSKHKQVEWTPTLTEHFGCLKAKVGQTPVLAIPDFDKDFFVIMNASDFAVGGVPYRKEVHDGVEVERPVTFAGRKYKPAELNYSMRENELLAILFGLRTWRDRPFVVETDHKSLETVFKQKSISRRIARWYDELAEYQFQIRYITGAETSVADVAEAVRRYDEDDTTKALLRLLDPRYSAKKGESTPLASPRLLERYSLFDGRLFYQAGHHDSPRLVLYANYWSMSAKSSTIVPCMPTLVLTARAA